MPLRFLGRSTSRSRRAAVAFVATLAAITLVGTFGATPTLAADSLRLAVTTTYRVDPPKAVIHVSLDVSATNLKPSTATRYFYYNTLSFGLQEEARSIKATQGGRRLSVSTETRDGYRDLEVRTPRLLYRQTHRTRITFDLPGGAPRSPSPIRVGLAHVAFTAWAWGDPGLADVRIVMPPDFYGDAQAWPADTNDDLHSTSVDGRLTYVADDIDDPNEWHATVNSSNRDALTDVRLDVHGERVTIHAWPEDEEWIERVSSALEFGLPDLEEAIGLPWPVTHDFGVFEVSSAEIEGYGGLFDSVDFEIEISEAFDEQVIVHEVAHAWFNRDLFVQRWIGEGLADEYAARVVAANGGDSAVPSRVTPGDRVAFPLNAWPPASRIDEETEDVESYGYDASWTVIRVLVDEVTAARMREVIEAADARTLPYVGAGPAATSAVTPDWRRFLDLLEDVGGSTKAAGLFEDWVLTDAERTELADRAQARDRYDALVEAGGDWLPGDLIRRPMSLWRFDDAESAMASAETLLAARDELRSATGELGLPFPATLEAAYEGADSADDLETLDARLEAWLRAAAAVRSARDALGSERAPLVAVGLLGTAPDTAYTEALAAFAAGDDAAALAGSSATLSVLAGAEGIGRDRALMVGAAVALVVLLLFALILALWLHRRRSRRVLRAGPAGPDLGAADASASPLDPYATLAATPDQVGGTEVDGTDARGAEPD